MNRLSELLEKSKEDGGDGGDGGDDVSTTADYHFKRGALLRKVGAQMLLFLLLSLVRKASLSLWEGNGKLTTLCTV